MTTYKQIEKQQQLIARAEQSLALEKLKKRRADKHGVRLSWVDW